MNDISIRPATPADIPAITRIYAHAVRHGTASFELEPPDEAEMTRRQRALLDGGYPYLVAEIDGAVDRATPMRGPTGRGRPIASASRTRSTSRRTRIAAASAACCSIALIAECETRGYRLMIAVIGDSAQTPSIELHRAAGFKMVGAFEGVGYKFDRWLDTC